MSMGELPFCILSTIVSNIEAPLAAYATISKPWKAAIESFTFRKLRIDSPERLNQLSEIVTHDRRSAVRTIDLTILLPEYSSDKYGQVESNEEKEQNNVVFTESLMKIYQTLHDWQNGLDGKGSSHAGSMVLSVQAISKSDLSHMDEEAKQERRQLAESGEAYDILDTRFEASYLHLTEKLPEVSAISDLTIYGLNVEKFIESDTRGDTVFLPRLISGTAAAHMMQSCTQLQRADLRISDQESKDLALRERERAGFAQELTTLPPTLVHFRLEYPGVVPDNHDFLPPPVSPTADGADLFSRNMGALSQQLVTLDLKGVISTEVFRSEGTWPYLKHLDLTFMACTPAGDWMIERDPEDSDDEIDEEPYESLSDWMREPEIPARMHYPNNPFRTIPRQDHTDQLFLAAGKAAARMPRVQQIDMRIDPEILDFQFADNGSGAGLVRWETLSCQTLYQPSDQVVALWKKAFELRIDAMEIHVT